MSGSIYTSIHSSFYCFGAIRISLNYMSSGFKHDGILTLLFLAAELCDFEVFHKIPLLFHFFLGRTPNILGSGASRLSCDYSVSDQSISCHGHVLLYHLMMRGEVQHHVHCSHCTIALVRQ